MNFSANWTADNAPLDRTPHKSGHTPTDHADYPINSHYNPACLHRLTRPSASDSCSSSHLSIWLPTSQPVFSTVHRSVCMSACLPASICLPSSFPFHSSIRHPIYQPSRMPTHDDILPTLIPPSSTLRGSLQLAGLIPIQAHFPSIALNKQHANGSKMKECHAGLPSYPSIERPTRPTVQPPAYACTYQQVYKFILGKTGRGGGCPRPCPGVGISVFQEFWNGST